MWRKATELNDEQLATLVGKLVSTPSIDIEREVITKLDMDKQDWIKHSFSRFAFITTVQSTTLYADSEAYECSNELAEKICAGEVVNGQDFTDQDKRVLAQLVIAGSMQEFSQ